jgi:hypothetical protein
MTSLPDALRPWREWLSWFEPDLAVQLGPMLQRLHPLLGSFKGHRAGGEPELEGLDDLRLRGSYQHLLASEWLLAEDMPDEFLRRAVSGEHMFLAPRPRARRADRSVVALFDTGPMQFGAPRLAHIAIWILLARRAQQAQAEFRWGSLQSPGELLEARTNANLKTLLFRRTFATPNAVGLASWRDALVQSRTGGEIWSIGPSFDQTELQTAPSFTHRVCLQKDLEGTALEVSLFERGTERGIRLPLPESAFAAPLLRGRFTREAAPEQYTRYARAVALKRPPVISIDGSRVCLALRDEPGALIFMMPRSAMDQAATPHHLRWAGGCNMLAITCVGKAIGALLSVNRELRFWGTSLAKMPHPPQEVFHAPGGTAAWLYLGWLRAKSTQRVCVVDHSRRLLQWEMTFQDGRLVAAEQSLQLQRKEVLAMVQLHAGLLAYIYHEHDRVWFARLGIARNVLPQPRALCKAPPDAAVLFGRGNLCAVRLNKYPKETWAIGIWHDGLTVEAQLPGDSRAIGLMREHRSARTGLITLDRNILRLNFVDGGNEVLYAAPDHIVSCAVCPNTGNVAMLTHRRQLIVVSSVTRELRLSVQTSNLSHESA